MYSKYYQQELFNLRELAREFAEVHPAIAPMLSGQSSDPDVERLLEGTAFLSGLLRQKIDDQLPEVIHGLTNDIFPQFLKSIPAVTLVRFTPKKGLQESLSIPAGMEMGARTEDGAFVRFQTSFPCTVNPLEITKVTNSGSAAQGQQIEITFHLTGPTLEAWIPDRLTFFIGGSYTRASDIFYLLTRKLQKISVQPVEGGSNFTLDINALQPVGFGSQYPMLPYPGNAFAGYRLLQEFFLLPPKFLFFELQGLDNWRDRGGGSVFTLQFELEPGPVNLHGLNLDSFLLSTVPAVNTYSHDADPIILDHTRDKLRVVPALQDGKRPEVYSVDKVVGFSRGAMKKIEYTEDSHFSSKKNTHIYSQLHSISPVQNRPEVMLQFAYPMQAEPITEETLSIKLTCMDGDLPWQLKPGDVCLPTSSTPELVDFSNLMQPTLPIDPPLAGDLLWRLLSHLSLNLLSLDGVDNLTELLSLYIFSQDRDRGRLSANRKRLDGIEKFTVEQCNRLIRGQMMRGQKIFVVARSDHFAGLGDFCLFGTVLDNFFAEYCSLNTFTQFDLTDSVSGETFSWPIRVGSKSLI